MAGPAATRGGGVTFLLWGVALGIGVPVMVAELGAASHLPWILVGFGVILGVSWLPWQRLLATLVAHRDADEDTDDGDGDE